MRARWGEVWDLRVPRTLVQIRCHKRAERMWDAYWRVLRIPCLVSPAPIDAMEYRDTFHESFKNKRMQDGLARQRILSNSTSNKAKFNHVVSWTLSFERSNKKGFLGVLLSFALSWYGVCTQNAFLWTSIHAKNLVGDVKFPILLRMFLVLVLPEG